MRKCIYLFLCIALHLSSCGKSDELKSCEYEIENLKKENSNLKQQINKLIDENQQINSSYSNLNNSYDNLEYDMRSNKSNYSNVINNSKSQINDIIRKINWDNYNSLDEIIRDLKNISIMSNF